MDKNLIIYLSVGIVSLIIILLIVLYFNIKTKKGRILKQINNLENEKLEINKIPVNTKLIKISMIGQSNVVFMTLYQEHKLTYDNILKEYNDSLDQSIKETRDLCMSGNLKLVNENIKNIEIRLNSFKRAMNELYDVVSKVLSEDDELNKTIEPLNLKFNECENLYNNYKIKTNFNLNRYDNIFKNIRENFLFLNEYMIKGKYIEANDLVKKLTITIDELYRNLNVSTNYVDKVINKIPLSINNVIDKYNDMVHKEFPLYNVRANVILEKVKEELKLLINQITEFDYKDIDDKIESITSKISHLDYLLDNEKQARNIYDSKMKKIYDHSQDLESSYLSTFRKYSNLNSSYNTNNYLNKIMDDIKKEDNKLNATLRQLDSLNYGVQPYSLRLTKLNELEQENLKFESLLNSLNDYVNNIQSSCKVSTDLVKKSALNLKQLEIKVRNTNITGLKNMYSDAFMNGYQMIKDLENTINKKPIDVKKCDSLSLRVEELVNELNENINRNLELLNDAEQLLMFSVQYKRAFEDFGKAHMKAESYFYDCRYDACIDILCDALKDKQIEIPFKVRG